MVKRRLVSPLPNLSSIKLFSFKKIVWKLTLGVFFLILFSNYQPSFPFSPFKKINKVYAAENDQTQTITSQSVNTSFQLPHPGYLSTYFSSFHQGIDIATGLGMPIKAIAPGTVIDSGFNVWGLGLVVEIDHENGYKSLYAHMGRTFVAKGQKVTENDYLGEVGLTGYTTGPHTHLEISLNDQKINPLTILPEIRTYPEPEDFVAQGGAVSDISEKNRGKTASESAIKVQVLSTPEPTLEPTPSSTPQPTALELLVNDQTIQPKTDSILDQVHVEVTNELESSEQTPKASEKNLGKEAELLIEKLTLTPPPPTVTTESSTTLDITEVKKNEDEDLLSSLLLEEIIKDENLKLEFNVSFLDPLNIYGGTIDTLDLSGFLADQSGDVKTASLYPILTVLP